MLVYFIYTVGLDLQYTFYMKACSTSAAHECSNCSKCEKSYHVLNSNMSYNIIILFTLA